MVIFIFQKQINDIIICSLVLYNMYIIRGTKSRHFMDRFNVFESIKFNDFTRFFLISSYKIYNLVFNLLERIKETFYVMFLISSNLRIII